jgi:uncharacterized protein (DUF4213/DUF364 family)
MLINELKHAALEKAADKKVADVRIGLGYTGVMLDDGSAGAAYTFRDKAGHGCSVLSDKQLAGSPAADVVERMSSDNLIERTVGIAAANSLLNAEGLEDRLEGYRVTYGDLLDAITITKEDRVGMVGFFAPIVPLLRNRVGEVLIFEKNPDRAAGLYSDEQVPDLLPSCSVAIITATSIINDTFGAIAHAASNSRIVAVLGASTPLAPDIFKSYGVTHLSGVIITDPVSILRVISEGKGMRFFRGLIKKVNVILSR